VDISAQTRPKVIVDFTYRGIVG